ncbi:MAG: hypothetical protein RLZZ436_2001 [Planctomycetota bacterium]|jgi:thiol-disulfide isomerase/thioredoxin
MKLLLLLSLLADSGTSAAPPDVELLDFTASYCQPCRQMLPIIQRMEQDQFRVRRVDISDEPDLSAKFRITGVPTLIVMVEGREVQRFVGLTSENVLREAMLRATRTLEEKRGTQPAKPRTADLVAEEVATTPSADTTDTLDTAEAPADRSAGTAPRRSLSEVFQRVFGGGPKSPGVIRGQSPSADEPQSGLVEAAEATVRVQVEGRSSEGGRTVREVGTGTIIHSVPAETLVLTCAHFFLNLQKSGSTVTVEVFENGRPEAFSATVVGGSHTLDLAVLRIVPRRVLPAVAIAAKQPEVNPGQELVSFGCDAGRPPGRLDTALVAINKYLGADNLVCTKDPATGRSGGGLYTADGTLVGVCSCADREKSQGLYMAWKSVLAMLQELKLEHLLSGSAENPETPADAAPEVAGTDTESTGTAVAESEADLEFDPLATIPDASETSSAAEPSAPSEPSDSAIADADSDVEADVMPAAAAGGPEVTIIIDEKTPGSQKKVIVIPRASPWLMEMLTGEGRGVDAAASQRRSPAARRSAEVSRSSTADGVVQAAYPSGE